MEISLNMRLVHFFIRRLTNERTFQVIWLFALREVEKIGTDGVAMANVQLYIFRTHRYLRSLRIVLMIQQRVYWMTTDIGTMCHNSV